jgi:UDP-N-acetylglucosamine 2-epimerase (non-hydrolysing)
VLSVFGTRPEAIKMAPVVKALAADLRIESLVCVTGQHRQMLDNLISLFKLAPHFDLNIMKPAQELSDVTCSVLTLIEKVIRESRPHLLLVQGDTTSAMAAALAAFYNKVPVGHVEAGLRTRDLALPWPEEANRRLIGAIATLHFAPTEQARRNLLDEQVPHGQIVLTGNTVVDALYDVLKGIREDDGFVRRMHESYPFLPDPSRAAERRRFLLVTGHRRESFGAGMENICMALRKLAERDDVFIAYPVHLNPNVREPTSRILGGRDNIRLLPPLEYREFVYFMHRAHIILTDSGGVQEEAPALGKPVLVMRSVTERGEGLAGGTVRLVGADAMRIVTETERLLDDAKLYSEMNQVRTLYGDGMASARIVEAILAWSERGERHAFGSA